MLAVWDRPSVRRKTLEGALRGQNPRLTPSLSFSENLRSGVDAKPMDLANDERLKRLTDQIEHGKDPHRVLELAQELLRLLDGGPEDRLLDKSSC